MRCSLLLGAAVGVFAVCARLSKATSQNPLMPDVLTPTDTPNRLMFGIPISDGRKRPALQRRGQGSADYDASLEMGGSLRGRVRANMHDIIVASRRVDAEEAAAILSRERAAAHATPAAATAAAVSAAEHDAELCEGAAKVTVDLRGSGLAGLLDRPLVAPGLSVMTAANTAADKKDDLQHPLALLDGAAASGLVCLVPVAVCGAGIRATMRFDVAKPLQLHGAVLCDPEPTATSRMWVRSDDLRPADAYLAGAVPLGPEVQAREIGASTVPRGEGSETPGSFKGTYVGVPASSRAFGLKQQARIALPLDDAGEDAGRQLFVDALDRFLTIVYNADAEFQRTKEAVKKRLEAEQADEEA